jgi:hypothetical protein
MKKLFVIVALLHLTGTLFSQDLIVTNEGDSINCRITKIKMNKIYYAFMFKNEVRNIMRPISGIKTYKFEYYQTSEVPKEIVTGIQDYNKFRVAVNVGYSYQTAKVAESVPSDFKDYINELKSGYHLGVDATYFFSETLGFGLKYSRFLTSNSINNIYVTDEEGFTRTGKMSDDLTISFFGPTFSSRLLNHDKTNAFLMSVAIGYLSYSNDKVIIDNFKMTSNTMGLSIDMGYDIGLSENLSLGVQISYLMATLTQFELDDGHTKQTIELEEGEYEGLNRIDLSVGLRFNL